MAVARFRVLLAMMAALLFGLPVKAADVNFTALRTGATTIDGAPATRLVIEMSQPINGKIFLLDNPYRVVLDVANANWDAGNLLPTGTLDEAGLASYRFGRPTANVGRLVFEMTGPYAPVNAFLLPPRQSGGHRLVIDLQDNGRTAYSVAKAALKKQPFIAELSDMPASQLVTSSVQESAQSAQVETSGRERVVSIATPTKRPKRWVVMIDAGHGGKDPGALGKSGTREKDITLKAARILAKKLNATGLVAAKLTRNDDRFLKLRERINVARRAQADLFISLHADAFHKSSARGISVFSLSDKASDKEAAYLANSENKADLIGGPDLDVEDPVAANELLRMFQRESMNESAYFADAILSQINDLPGGDKRGHRFAGFAVLKSPDIPSVLVEMGFLTNKADEANLRKTAYLDKLATRLKNAIIAYLKQSGR
ncbi:MAG: N-acetylmuramoyl-L-alanine amidase [Candidatus Puniceispirillaceae bacterium]